MKKTISREVAEGMLNMAAFITTSIEYCESNVPPTAEWVSEMARTWFNNYCEMEGIEEVEE